MAKYKAYPEYKDSGVDFLGLVPNEWSIKSLKNIVMIFNGSTPKSGVEEYWDGDVNWITPTDLSQKSGVYLTDSQRKITKKGLDSCGTSLVPENTVILSTRAPIGSLAITGTQSCTNQGCKSLVAKYKESSLFLYYYLSISTSPLKNLGRGSTFLELSTEDLASFKVPMPNVGIGTIVSFLEHETAKIDNLIEKQQQLIELLKEKRLAVISHAVTKGLNPDVPMKDSGVEWLGEVPEHWTIAQLKFNTIEMQTGPFGSQLHAEDYVVDGIPLINPAHMNAGMIIPDPKVTVDEATQERLGRHKLSEGEIIFSRRGELGRCAVVKKNNEGWLCGTGSLKAKLTKKIIPDYAYTLISSEGVVSELTLESKGSTMANLNTETLGRIRLPVPPISEQEAILDYIKIISDKYDYLIRSADTAIRLMQERRTALISAAVTGKIDVRDWVAPDTQDVEEPQEATA
ncbi:TPA: restriction endonuclease subunit S [Klebsiella quasipneumoniae]|nr:restriction endonuclease subunit S [Klebsiella quasipneumoniae]